MGFLVEPPFVERTILFLGPWALVWSIVFSSHLLRYVAASGVVDLAVQHFRVLQRARVRNAEATEAERRREFRSSIKAGAIFAFQFLPIAYAIPAGWTRLYFEVDRYGWLYLVVSFFLTLFVHDTYFYWTHRWMHHPRFFRSVHQHHHLSRSPSAWAAFSFHPLESLVQGGIHLILPFLLPLHVSVMTAFVLWATLYSALIHCGHDLFFTRGCRSFRAHARVLNTTADHDAHHAGVRGNFALYFSFWDWLMGTRAQADHHRPIRFAEAIQERI